MKKIGVIGAGISGGLAARILSTRHDVTLFEAGTHAGGHARTVDVSLPAGRFSVDTGFMVFNRRTYPNFTRLLDLLEVPARLSDMSFSVRCDRTGWEYQGSSLNGLFAQRSNVLRPEFLRMITDILRFNRRGRRAAASGELRDGRSVATFLAECGVGRRFVEQYLVPMAAAIWSSDPESIGEFPSEFMIGFFANHGLLQLRDRPAWQTVVGGSREYVRRMLEPLGERLRLSCPVVAVRRTQTGVLVITAGAAERFDEVVFATHADRTLALLQDATALEREILSAFPYQDNEAVLHTDCRLLPTRRRAWASWNYHVSGALHQRRAAVTYDLSRLQGHPTSLPILLTLNPVADIAVDSTLDQFNFRHPSFSLRSNAAQQRVSEISGRNRTHYCGAYWGYGFHEDGVNSALRVASHFGLNLDSCTAASTKARSRIAAMSR